MSLPKGVIDSISYEHAVPLLAMGYVLLHYITTRHVVRPTNVADECEVIMFPSDMVTKSGPVC